MAKFPVDQWRVLLLRLTGFPAAPMPGADDRVWWQSLTTSAPDERTVRRGDIVQEAGPFEWKGLKVWLGITSNASRIDVVARAPEFDPSALPDDFGAVTAVLPLARELGERLFTIAALPTPKRVALGATLVHPAATSDEALIQLVEFLPTVRLSPGVADLRYRLNRPRPSKANPEVRINRLAEWSVGHTTLVQVGPGGEEPTASSPISILELDINTPAERTDALPRQDVGSLIGEMSELALELAEHGDIE
jgi:hypothetical protein